MTGIERDPGAEAAYAGHLERSRTVWDRWSSRYGMSERDLEPLRLELLDRLGLEAGDRVLEIGCGPGVNFEPICEAVGPSGRLTAVDYSPEMVDRARERVETLGTDTVTVVQADATTADLGGPYDAAVATLSLSVMPDIERAVANIHRVLEPGGVLGGLDVRPVPDGPLRVVNPLLSRFLRWYANWNETDDVLRSVETVFGGVEVTDTSLAGTLYQFTARRSG